MSDFFKYVIYFFLGLGIAFSYWNTSANNDIFCVTEACQVFADFTLFDVSLWTYSLVFFAVLLILMALKQYSILYLFAILGLFVDSLLLMLMFFTAPCFNCLIIACILACLGVSLHLSLQKTKKLLPIFLIWTFFFILNGSAVVKNLIKPYTIYHSQKYATEQEASMRIYFSPSCSSCLSLVSLLGDKEMTDNTNIAWFPVPENSKDIDLILQLDAYIEQGDSLKESMSKLSYPPALQTEENITTDMSIENLFKIFSMRIMLLVNQSHLSARGTNKIPFVEYTGVPAFLQSEADNSTTADDVFEALSKLAPPSDFDDNTNYNNKNQKTKTPLNFGVGSFCESGSDIPCE